MSRRIVPVFFFASVMMLAFWKAVFHPEFTLLTGGDMCSQAYPWLNVAAYWFKHDVILLWDPYVYSGKPNLGELQPGAFYPLNWIFMLVWTPGGGMNLRAMDMLLVAHYFLAAYFTYRLALSFGMTRNGACVAGIVFALGGYMIQISGFVNIFSGFVWMPLVFLAYRRALDARTVAQGMRWAIAGALALALSFLAGHHLPPIFTVVFVALYGFFRTASSWRETSWPGRFTPAALLGGLALGALLLTALQWFPSLEYARLAYRWVSSGDPLRWGQKIPYSVLEETARVHTQDALSLVLPYTGVDANLYVGPSVLLLALIGMLCARHREAKVFVIALVVSFLLSWGKLSALHGWFNTFVPGLWFGREASHYLVPFELCLALLAGWGLDHLVTSYSRIPEHGLRRLVRRFAAALAVLVLVAGTLMAVLRIHQGFEPEHPYLRALGGLAVYMLLAGLLLFLLETGRLKPRRFGWLVTLVLLVDLSSNISSDIRTVTRGRAESNPAVHSVWKMPAEAEFLKHERKKEYFRVDDPDQLFPPNFGDGWLLESTMGHGATGLVRYFEFRGTGWGPGSNATALLAARYIVSRERLPWMKEVFPSVYRNARAVPRAFLASRYRALGSDQQILQWLSTPLFAPRECVLLPAAELERVPAGIRAALRNGVADIEIRALAFPTAVDKAMATLPDDSARRWASVFQPPWGWSIGDELVLEIRPVRPVERCFLILNFYPTQPAPSRVDLRLEDGPRTVSIRVNLPGLQQEKQEESLSHVAVELGPLAARGYRLSLVRSESCTANLDSLRVVRSLPEAGDEGPGAIRITSFRPNRITLEAELTRPALAVLSELSYPGWEATVDRAPAPVLAADYILRAVPVPEGKHEIVLRYRPRSFRLGFGISILSLAVMGVVSLYGFTRS